MTTKADNEDVANRRAQLKRWIKDHYHTKQADFVEATGINQGELSGLLKAKSFGEKRARSLERLAGMPEKYLEARSPGALAKDAPTPPLANDGPLGTRTWPFKRITPAQYAKLGAEEMLLVEHLAALLLSRSGVRGRSINELVHGLTLENHDG